MISSSDLQSTHWVAVGRLRGAAADFDAAGVAVAEVVLIQTIDGLINFLDQFALPIPGAQFDAELFFLGRAVSRDPGN